MRIHRARCLMRGLSTGTLGALALTPATALARGVTRVEIERTQPAATFQLGGGVMDYTEGLDEKTNPGGAWTARITFAPKRPFGLEAAYSGSLARLRDEDANLATHGGEALVRANFGGERGVVQPFLGAGVGFAGYQVVDRGNFFDAVERPGVRRSTDVLIPAAGGLDFYLADNVLLTMRVDYKYSFDNEVLETRRPQDIQLWAASGTLGAAF